MPDNDEAIYPVMLTAPVPGQALFGKDRVAFLRQYARQAVVLSAIQKGLSLSSLLNDGDGRPIPENGVFWSLSHKPEIMAGIAAREPVGIDVETIRPVRPGLMERITDAHERRLTDSVTDIAFFRFWTAKEAVLKAAGEGLRGLPHCKVHHVIHENALIISCRRQYWRVEHAFCGLHIASAACPLEVPMKMNFILI